MCFEVSKINVIITRLKTKNKLQRARCKKMEIGENIRLLRISKRMSQKELAKKVNVSDSMIAYIENGQRVLPRETGKRIAQILGCTFTDLTTKEYQVLTK